MNTPTRAYMSTPAHADTSTPTHHHTSFFYSEKYKQYHETSFLSRKTKQTKTSHPWGWRGGSGLQVCTVLLGDPHSVPITNATHPTTARNSFGSIWCLQHPQSSAHTCTPMIHTCSTIITKSVLKIAIFRVSTPFRFVTEKKHTNMYSIIKMS